MFEQTYTNVNSPGVLNIPAIPIQVKVGMDTQSAALTAFFLFLALLLALLIFGFVFKK